MLYATYVHGRCLRAIKHAVCTGMRLRYIYPTNVLRNTRALLPHEFRSQITHNILMSGQSYGGIWVGIAWPWSVARTLVISQAHARGSKCESIHATKLLSSQFAHAEWWEQVWIFLKTNARAEWKVFWQPDAPWLSNHPIKINKTHR